MHGSVVSEDLVRSVAERLAGAPARAIQAATSGANSRIFRVDTAAGVFALKSYPSRANDTRNRADVEWRALLFLNSRGVTSVPRPFARDADGHFLLMEWIEGSLLKSHEPGHVAQAAQFIAQIFSLSSDAEAAQFPLASEACLSADEIIAQIETRLPLLANHGPLGSFLATTFHPALLRAKEHARPGAGPELDATLRRLIPADFGFHNVVREPAGKLRYIDFEYFGWDDPAKVTADFLLHPAMTLNEAEQRDFVSAMRAALAHDLDFDARLKRHIPLFALRWVLILFNPFRADRVSELPRDPSARDALFADRLGKAEKLLPWCDPAIVQQSIA
jgi:hypothetical protein